MRRREMLVAMAGGLLNFPAAAAEVYPTKAITLLVPFPAGGAADVMGRLLAKSLGDALGQVVVVDNRPGASGIIGAAAVAKAAPDGYTLLLSTKSTHSLAAATKSSLPYDVERSFAPIIEVASGKSVLLVSSSLGVSTVPQLIALMKRNAADNNFGSAGVGTLAHLNGEAFKIAAGVQATHVPYKGMSLALQDLIGGRITFMFDSAVSALSAVRTGKVRALAVASQRTTPVLPGVPTLKAAGVPGYDMEGAYFGLWAPAGTPVPVVDLLNKAANAALASKEMLTELANLAADPAGGSSADFAQRVSSDVRKWKALIQNNGIAVE